MIAMLVNYTVILFTHSYWVTVFCIFIFGGLSTVSLNIGFQYFMELIVKRERAWYATVYNIIDFSVYSQMVYYFLKISKHWFYFYGLGWVANLIGLVMILYIPESPLFLI